MFKQNTRRRILSFAFAVMMLITSAVPAFAMGYDDLQTVIDMTGTAASESAGEGDFSPEDIQQEPDSPIGPLEDMGESEDSKTPSPEDETVQEQSPEQNPPGQDVSEEPAREEISSTDETQPDEPEGAEKAGDTDASADEATIGASDGWLIPDGHVLYMDSGGPALRMSRASNQQTAIYIESDWSMTHRYPFGSGTSTMPAYIFTTADGRTAYCIEPARFNSTYGHVVTGQLQYDKLSLDKQLEIARAIAANSAGSSNHRMYLAAQAIIWEIASGQSHRGGSIYNDVIAANGLSSEYESILSGMQNLGGDIPSFMGEEKNNAP